MTTNELIKEHLVKNINAREHKNKNRFIAFLLWKKYHLSDSEMSADVLENIVIDTSTYDRAWRQVRERNPDLRGSDYDEKVVLEQQKILDLGYEI